MVLRITDGYDLFFVIVLQLALFLCCFVSHRRYSVLSIVLFCFLLLSIKRYFIDGR